MAETLGRALWHRIRARCPSWPPAQEIYLLERDGKIWKGTIRDANLRPADVGRPSPGNRRRHAGPLTTGGPRPSDCAPLEQLLLHFASGFSVRAQLRGRTYIGSAHPPWLAASCVWHEGCHRREHLMEDAPDFSTSSGRGRKRCGPGPAHGPGQAPSCWQPLLMERRTCQGIQ